MPVTRSRRRTPGDTWLHSRHNPHGSVLEGPRRRRTSTILRTKPPTRRARRPTRSLAPRPARRAHTVRARATRKVIRPRVNLARRPTHRPLHVKHASPVAHRTGIQHHKGHKVSAAARQHMSAGHKGKKHPHKGHPMSREARLHESLARLGKHHPHKGHPMSAASRLKDRLSHLGKPHPHKGHPMSAATRLKISLAERGKPKKRLTRVRTGDD